MKIIKRRAFLLVSIVFIVSCTKQSSEIKWTKDLNQPSTLTNILWTQDTTNSIGRYEFVDFLPEPANTVKFTNYNGSSIVYENWIYNAENSMIVSKSAVYRYRSFDCIVKGNTLTITLGENTYTFINYE
jgi:hypothetical protein